MSATDWSGCPDVERIPDKVSGQWIVRGARILADGVADNVDAGVTVDELVTDAFPALGIERARRIIAYAKQLDIIQSTSAAVRIF